MDSLELCGLEVACVIGDRPEERAREQRLVVDASLELDLSAAGASDALADTVDYAALAEALRAELKRARFHMIESAAECVARVCLSDERVRAVRVRVEKPGAIAGLRAAAVVIGRGREEALNAQVPASGLRSPASDVRLTEGVL
jgi:dihydroneopterin aldolase